MRLCQILFVCSSEQDFIFLSLFKENWFPWACWNWTACYWDLLCSSRPIIPPPAVDGNTWAQVIALYPTLVECITCSSSEVSSALREALGPFKDFMQPPVSKVQNGESWPNSLQAPCFKWRNLQSVFWSWVLHKCCDMKKPSTRLAQTTTDDFTHINMCFSSSRLHLHTDWLQWPINRN